MNQHVRVNTAELIGQALNWAMALAEGKQARITKSGVRLALGGSTYGKINPATDEKAGTLAILRHCVRFDVWLPGHQWAARVGETVAGGPTITIAACRAIAVASLGDVIDIPAELI